MLTPADHALFSFAATHHSVFDLRDATAVGLTEAQVRNRAAHLWERIHDGVFRIPGAAATWRGDLKAAVLAGGEGAAASHRSAAELDELPGGRRDLIEISCRRWDRAKRAAIVVHESRRLDSCDLREVDGIAVTTTERTILDLAFVPPSPEFLERVIHAARRRKLVTYESTR